MARRSRANRVVESSPEEDSAPLLEQGAPAADAAPASPSSPAAAAPAAPASPTVGAPGADDSAAVQAIAPAAAVESPSTAYCTGCKKTLPKAEFITARGAQAVRCSVCREAHRKGDEAFRKERKRKAEEELEEAKAGRAKAEAELQLLRERLAAPAPEEYGLCDGCRMYRRASRMREDICEYCLDLAWCQRCEEEKPRYQFQDEYGQCHLCCYECFLEARTNAPASTTSN